MKIKLLKKLRKRLSKGVVVEAVNLSPRKKKPEFKYYVYDDGCMMGCRTPICGGWANEYDPENRDSALWFAGRLIERMVECEAYKMRVKRGKAMNHTLKL